LQWLKWHHGANVLLAGTVSGDVYMWRIPGGDCKLLPGGGVKTDCGLILPDGMRVIYSCGIISYIALGIVLAILIGSYQHFRRMCCLYL